MQPVASPAYHQVKTWKDCVQDWYPDLLQRAHFMPHVYMNRVLHDTVQVSGVDVAVPQSPVDTQHKGGAQALLHSDVRDDTAQQHVLHCLRKIADGALSGKPEVMFVLSQMNFGDYLNSPGYSSAAS
nr:hypothetical protein BaRGS_031240 [Batillaria attramentaria]